MDIALLILIGFLAGTLGSLLGLGGGFLIVPALVFLKSMDIKMASGTSVAIIVPAMLVAMWQRGGRGHIDWRLAGIVAIGAVVGPFVGSWLADQLPATVVRKVFAFVLVGLAALLFFKKPQQTPETAPIEAGRAQAEQGLSR